MNKLLVTLLAFMAATALAQNPLPPYAAPFQRGQDTVIHVDTGSVDCDSIAAGEGLVKSGSATNCTIGINPILMPSTLTYQDTWVNLIIDSDIGEDPDDILSIALANRLADLGEVHLIAMGYVGRRPYGAADLAALNTLYGRPNIPIGTQKTNNGYWGADNYGSYLATFPNNIHPSTVNTFDAAPNVVNVYRKALLGAADHSVTMLFEGQMTNLFNLYNSAPDTISSLTGAALMLQKCAKVVILGGIYPSGWEFDFYSDTASAQVINQLAATLPVVYSGGEYGDSVYTISKQPTWSAVRASFDSGLAAIGVPYRPSWGAMATLYCIRGLSHGGDTYSTLSGKGTNHVDDTGGNVFTVDGIKNQHYLILAMNKDTMAARIQSIVDTLPRTTLPSGTLINYGMTMQTPLSIPGLNVLGTSTIRGPLHVNGYTFDGQAAIIGVKSSTGVNAGFSIANTDQSKVFYFYLNPGTNPELLHLYSASGAADIATFNGITGASGFPHNTGFGTVNPLYASHTIVPYDKTDATPRFGNAVISSNETSAPFGLIAGVVGGADDAVRGAILQTGQFTSTTAGILYLQLYGGSVNVGGGIKFSALSGSGDAPLCLDATGTAYRGTNTVGVLTCP